MAVTPSSSRPPSRRFGLLRGIVPALALWAVVPAASAGPVEDALARGDEALARLESQTTDLEGDLGPGGMIDELEAVQRFQDSLFLHLVGDFEPAAEGFFALVTTGALADAGLHRDAEWYLAESLLGLENYKTAEERFAVIVGDADHPFRADAVRRMLELYTRKGDVDAFRALYDREIVSGNVEPTPEVTYSLARSFYRQGELAEADRYFARIEEGTDWFAKARYFAGVIAVREDRLDDAVQIFSEVANLTIPTADARRVHDLSLLALGRIHYERGDYLQAAIEYNRISGDSEYQADKLYEVIWTSIKQERYQEAINNIEIFLLAYPEHRYSAQLMLNQGHLAMMREDWSGALINYEQVIVDYEPVRSRFATLADPTVDNDASIQAVLDLNNPELEGGLPSYALAMMRADPELSRAIDVFRDLDRQRRDIETSEAIIADLESVMSGQSSMSNLARVRYDAILTRVDVLESRLALVEGEEQWLRDDPAGAEAAEGLAARREELESALAGGVAEATTFEDRLSRYESRLAALKSEAETLRATTEAARGEVDDLRSQLEANEGLDAPTRRQVESDLEAAEAELDEAEAEAADLEAQIAGLRAPDVLGELARTGFELSELSEATEELVADARAARPPSRSLITDRLDALQLTGQSLDDRLAQVMRAAQNSEGSELGRFRKRFEQERADVAVQRADYAASLDEAKGVSLRLTRQGFGRLEDFFADSVLKADTGIVDVYWAQKLEVADEIERVKEEKTALLIDLQQRFKLIRQKIGE